MHDPQGTQQKRLLTRATVPGYARVGAARSLRQATRHVGSSRETAHRTLITKRHRAHDAPRRAAPQPRQGWPGPDVEQDGARRPGGSFRARTPPAATQVLARHLPDPF